MPCRLVNQAIDALATANDLAAMDSGSSLPLGSIAGIPVRLHVTFPLLFVMGLLAEAASYSWSGASVGWAAIMYGPVLLGTVLLHELGHCLAARQAGGHADGILLWPLGGLAYIAHASGPKADLFIALAGPATHIPQFLVWFACLFPAYHAAYGSWSVSLAIPPPQQHFGLAVVAGACQLNLALAAFNLLLPAYPLDGGRIFADLLLLAGLHTKQPPGRRQVSQRFWGWESWGWAFGAHRS